MSDTIQATDSIRSGDAAKPSPGANRLSVARAETYARDILTQVEANRAVSQRSIAREMGIALGLANLMLRRMANRGLIRLVHVRPNRVLYLITPKGVAEKARMTAAYVARNVQSYRETRDRIRSRFAALSESWPDSDPGARKSLVFLGADEVAEIGFVCLHGTDLQLGGVVDASTGHNFFGHQVRSLAELSGLTLDGQPFGALMVMSLAPTTGLREELHARGVPDDRIFYLL